MKTRLALLFLLAFTYSTLSSQALLSANSPTTSSPDTTWQLSSTMSTKNKIGKNDSVDYSFYMKNRSGATRNLDGFFFGFFPVEFSYSGYTTDSPNFKCVEFGVDIVKLTKNQDAFKGVSIFCGLNYSISSDPVVSVDSGKSFSFSIKGNANSDFVEKYSNSYSYYESSDVDQNDLQLFKDELATGINSFSTWNRPWITNTLYTYSSPVSKSNSVVLSKKETQNTSAATSDNATAANVSTNEEKKNEKSDMSKFIKAKISDHPVAKITTSAVDSSWMRFVRVHWLTVSASSIMILVSLLSAISWIRKMRYQSRLERERNKAMVMLRNMQVNEAMNLQAQLALSSGHSGEVQKMKIICPPVEMENPTLSEQAS